MFSDPFRIFANTFIGYGIISRFSLSRAIGCRSGAYGLALVDYVDVVEQQRLLTISIEGERAKDNCDGRPTTISGMDIRPSVY